MYRMRLFPSAGVLGLVAACAGEDLPDSADLQNSELGAAAAGLTATFSAGTSWDGGFNGIITVSNTTGSAITGWELEFKLNGSASISGAPWGAAGSASKGD